MTLVRMCGGVRGGENVPLFRASGGAKGCKLTILAPSGRSRNLLFSAVFTMHTCISHSALPRKQNKVTRTALAEHLIITNNNARALQRLIDTRRRKHIALLKSHRAEFDAPRCCAGAGLCELQRSV